MFKHITIMYHFIAYIQPWKKYGDLCKGLIWPISPSIGMCFNRINICVVFYKLQTV